MPDSGEEMEERVLPNESWMMGFLVEDSLDCCCDFVSRRNTTCSRFQARNMLWVLLKYFPTVAPNIEREYVITIEYIRPFLAKLFASW